MERDNEAIGQSCEGVSVGMRGGVRVVLLAAVKEEEVKYKGLAAAAQEMVTVRFPVLHSPIPVWCIRVSS